MSAHVCIAVVSVPCKERKPTFMVVFLLLLLFLLFAVDRKWMPTSPESKRIRVTAQKGLHIK